MSRTKDTEKANISRQEDDERTLPKGVLLEIRCVNDGLYDLVIDQDMSGIDFFNVLSILRDYVDSYEEPEEPENNFRLPC